MNTHNHGGYNWPVVNFKPEKDVWQNGEALAKVMQSERIAHGLEGFFFDYGMNESSSHSRMSQSVKTAAGFLMQVARDARKPVKVFKNMNGQIAAAIL